MERPGEDGQDQLAAGRKLPVGRESPSAQMYGTSDVSTWFRGRLRTRHQRWPRERCRFIKATDSDVDNGSAGEINLQSRATPPNNAATRSSSENAG
jgi:hypothetical protein